MRGVRNERGGVLVMVAVWLPVLLIFLAFVVDVGNWFEHQRHLQMQVDAGALAGGDVYAIPCSSTTASNVTTTAHNYSGNAVNAQVGGDKNVSVVVNSANYPSQGGAADGDVCAPCPAPLDFPNERCVDLKATDANVPDFVRILSLFGGSNVVPAINAHARVAIEALTTRSGALPLAVPDVNPVQGAVQFIDESNPTGPPLATETLTKAGVGPTGLSLWNSNSSPWAPASLPAAATPGNCNVPNGYACIGVRVVLSGRQVGDPNALTCGQTLVDCYDLTSANGILYVRGYSSSGTATATSAPIARSVNLSPGTCSDGYFSVATASCSVAITAKIDMLSDGTGGKLTPSKPQNDFTIAAFGGGCPNKGCPLTYQSTANGTTTWATTSANYIPISPDTAGNSIQLQWTKTSGTIGTSTCKSGGSNPCTGTFGVVGRTFAAGTDNAGPIQVATVSDNGSVNNSLLVGAAHSLTVQIGITGSLQDAQSVSDKPVSLRVVGSQNQSIDCDPSYPNLRDEIANGCSPSYTINTGQACPSTLTALWSTAQPWNCVGTQTGSSVGQVTQGMQLRILGGANTCTAPNNWSQFPNFPAGDPRILPVFLTPFGTFDGSGNGVFPVEGFAYFYVTGWGGNGNNTDPCTSDDTAASGYIVGHFIKYVEKLDSQGGSGQACDPTTFTSCVAVMTQ
jgi:Putative Flp pilus-assembly TadE/G-like